MLNVQMLKCSNAQMFTCSYVQMFKCSNVQMFKRSDVKYQTSIKVKLLSERTSGVPPVIFLFNLGGTIDWGAQLSHWYTRRTRLAAAITVRVTWLVNCLFFYLGGPVDCYCAGDLAGT